MREVKLDNIMAISIACIVPFGRTGKGENEGMQDNRATNTATGRLVTIKIMELNKYSS